MFHSPNLHLIDSKVIRLKEDTCFYCYDGGGVSHIDSRTYSRGGDVDYARYESDDGQIFHVVSVQTFDPHITNGAPSRLYRNIKDEHGNQINPRTLLDRIEQSIGPIDPQDASIIDDPHCLHDSHEDCKRSPDARGRIVNDKTGHAVDSKLSDEEALQRILRDLPKSHWLWYHVHKIANEEPARKEMRDALVRISHLFLYSIGHGLKRPRIRVQYKDTRFSLYLSKRGTLCIKAATRRSEGHDLWNEQEYIGCIYQGKFLPGSTFYGSKEKREPTETEVEFLDNLRNRPIEFLADCSKDLGSCCYCNQPLDDPRSKRLGYGKICATRWGLPWGDPEYVEKAPTFAGAYNEDAFVILSAIQDDPQDDVHWIMFSDWCMDRGLPGAEKPATNVTLPLA